MLGTLYELEWIYNPYSLKSTKDYFNESIIPYYDNPLGIFNLLKQLSLDIYIDDYYKVDKGVKEPKYVRNSTAQLSGSFEYVVNQSAGFKIDNFSKENSDIEILACLQVDNIFSLSENFTIDDEEPNYKDLNIFLLNVC